MCDCSFGHEGHSSKYELSKFSLVITTNFIHVTEQSTLFIFQTLYITKLFAWQLQTLGSFNNAKFYSYSPCIFCLELIVFSCAFSGCDVATCHLITPVNLLKSGTLLTGDFCDKFLMCINERVTVEYDRSINRLTCDGISK